jgi:uncharacterized protein (DUF3084 family)
MGTALVVGLLIAMCGAIAYVGDLLGRRMGKKRLSLFGLRPRHTAIVFTVITGMVIAAVTLGVLMLVSAGVRVAVTRGERLLHDNHRLKQERRALDRARQQLLLRNGDLEKSSAKLVERNEALRQTEQRLRHEAGDLQERNQALSIRNQALSKRNGSLEARNARLVQGNRTLTARNSLLSAENGRLIHTNQRLAQTNLGLENSNAELIARNRRLQRLNTSLKQASAAAQQELAGIQERALRVAQSMREQSEQATKSLREQSERSAELEVGKVIVRAREELSRRVIPAGASADSVRATIQGLLDDADAAVAHRERRPLGHRRRVRLDPHGAPPERLLDEMVEALMTESHPVNGQLPTTPMPETHPLVLRAIARTNAAAGGADPIDVDVVGRVNRRAFRRGEEVANVVIDTPGTSGQLLERLVAFLQQQVREAAVERSVIPNAAGEVGKTDYESLLEVVTKIKGTPGPVRIGAVAAEDAWAAGPLRLAFYVVPANTRVAGD